MTLPCDALPRLPEGWFCGRSEFADLIRLAARHARFVSWRRTWSHIVACRKMAVAPAENLPSALWSPGWVVERLDLPHCTGMAGAEVARRTMLKERLHDALLKSSAALPATTLGL